MPTPAEDSRRLTQASGLFVVIALVGLVLGLLFAAHVLNTNSDAGNWILAIASWVVALGAGRAALRTRRAGRALLASEPPAQA